MKANRAAIAAAVLGSIAGVASAQPAANQLLLVGAIESVNPSAQTIRILGHDIRVANVETHAVGHVVSVFGNGLGMQVSAISDSRVFATGAEPVLLSGKVTKVVASTGKIFVDGVAVDVTQVMATSGFAFPSQGSAVTVLGTQPALGGVVLAGSINRGYGVTSGGQSVGVTSGGQSVGVTSGGQSVGVTSGGQSVGVTSGGRAI